MEYKLKNLSKTQVEMTLSIAVEDQKKFLEKAAQDISHHVKIDGFRPGKATYEMLVGKLGEQAIFDHAVESILSFYLFDIIKKEKLETVGRPEVKITKSAAGNPLEATFVLSTMPHVKIGNYTSFKAEKIAEKVDEKAIDEYIADLRRQKANEVAKEGKIEKGNVARISLNVKINNVPIEGGQAQDMPIEVGSGRMIPGFDEELIGLAAGDEKVFELEFPKEYHHKPLQGKKADFEIKVASVFELQDAELNDEFAQKSMGAKDIKELREKVAQRIQSEKDRKTKQKNEVEYFEQLIDKSEFEPIPATMVDAEVDKLMNEFSSQLQQSGLNISDYMVQQNKTEAALKEDFKVQGEKRIKVALLMRAIAEKEKVKVAPEDISKEIEDQRTYYKQYLAALEKAKTNESESMKKEIKNMLGYLDREEYSSHIEQTLKNEKVIDFLNKEVFKYPEEKKVKHVHSENCQH